MKRNKTRYACTSIFVIHFYICVRILWSAIFEKHKWANSIQCCKLNVRYVSMTTNIKKLLHISSHLKEISDTSYSN